MKRIFIDPSFSLGYRVIILILLSTFSWAEANAQQQLTLHGTVTDQKNNPLLGVTVQISGSQNGTMTDASGGYQISAATGDSLIFHSVGYATQILRVGSSQVINVKLHTASRGLNEVVILGYGTQQKKDVTAAVTTVDVSKIKDISSANPTKLLVGQVPGAVISQTTGSPGREFNVIIRGLGSLGASSNPLYVVDGFPVGTSIGQNLNPDDIATITVLKDAVSTAIYGARGANGVILITTKKAEAGKTTLSVNAKYGIQNLPVSLRTKMMTGPEFAQFKKESFIDKSEFYHNVTPGINDIPIDYRYPDSTKYSTNWLNEILHNNAPYQNYNITFSSGKTDMHSLVSVGLINQDGSLIASNYRNYSVRANVDGKVNNFINVGLDLSGSYAELNWVNGTEGRGDAVGIALLADPRDPVYNKDGSFNEYIGGHDGIFGWPNPVQNLLQVTKRTYSGDGLATGFIEISFLRHFKFRSTANVHLNYNTYKQWVPSTIAHTNAPPPQVATENDNLNKTLDLDATQLLTYSNDFGAHHLDVLFGYDAQEENVSGLYANGSEYPNDLTPFLSSAAVVTAGSSASGWSDIAYFTRVNYSFKDRYLFSGTFRREGSSRFGSNNRYGNFPAISAGWRMSEEKFMSKINWLSELKLRASWGETGNNNIGDYSSLAFLNPSNYVLGGNFINGFVVGSFPNSTLGWEKSNQIDGGIDLGAFGNKLTFTADYYKRITTSMLLSISIPAISGFTSSLGNVGKVQNQGFEFALGYKTNMNRLSLWANGTLSINRNKVLALNGPTNAIWNGSLYADYNVSKVGRPIGMIYGFKTLGIFQNMDQIAKSPKQDGAIPGSFIYYDANHDGVVEYDQTDMVEIGNPWPKFTWGATFGGNYKNFDLTILLSGRQGYDNFMQIQSSTVNQDGVFNVLEDDKYRWRSERDPGKNYWPTTNYWKWERESNSRYVHDASHMWVKDITLGYSVPQGKLPFNLRIYLTGDNVFLFTHYPGSNPDVNINGGINPGLDDEAYPVPRTFAIGANLTF